MKKTLSFLFFLVLLLVLSLDIMTSAVPYGRVFAQSVEDFTTQQKFDRFNSNLTPMQKIAFNMGATADQKVMVVKQVEGAFDVQGIDRVSTMVAERVNAELALRFPTSTPRPPVGTPKSVERILLENRFLTPQQRADTALLGDAEMIAMFKDASLVPQDGSTIDFLPPSSTPAGTVPGAPSAPPPPLTEGEGGLVPCGNGTNAEDCQFEDLITLAKNVMNFLLFTIAVPVTALSFAWAGWLYLSAAGNEGKVKQAHEIFGYVVLGLALALAAWLIVNAIVIGLGVDSKYNFLGTT